MKKLSNLRNLLRFVFATQAFIHEEQAKATEKERKSLEELSLFVDALQTVRITAA